MLLKMSSFYWVLALPPFLALKVWKLLLLEICLPLLAIFAEFCHFREFSSSNKLRNVWVIILVVLIGQFFEKFEFSTSSNLQLVSVRLRYFLKDLKVLFSNTLSAEHLLSNRHRESGACWVSTLNLSVLGSAKNKSKSVLRSWGEFAESTKIL